jgi:hypothetical protein
MREAELILQSKRTRLEYLENDAKRAEKWVQMRDSLLKEAEDSMALIRGKAMKLKNELEQEIAKQNIEKREEEAKAHDQAKQWEEELEKKKVEMTMTRKKAAQAKMDRANFLLQKDMVNEKV